MARFPNQDLSRIESSDVGFVGLVLPSVINPDELNFGAIPFACMPAPICEKQGGNSRCTSIVRRVLAVVAGWVMA